MKLRIIIAIAAMAVLVAVSPAQGRRGFMRMGAGQQMNAFLLRRADVQDDLALSADQKSKLEDLQQDLQSKFRDAFQYAQSSSPEDRQKMMEKLGDDANKAVNAILNADQQKRLKEIGIQFAGNSAVMQKDVATQVGLTDDQKTKIQGLMDEQQKANQSIRDKVQSGEIDRSEIRALQEKNRKTLDDAIGNVLTADQKDKLKTLGGKPFVRKDNGG
jgi:Spy/CpxP family protein refolding chaperone